MKIFNKVLVLFVSAVVITLGLAGPIIVLAASTPSLGTADTFGILSSTYTNTAGGTTITGDLGYTTGPTVAPTVNGTTYVADDTYNKAGIDQGAALINLNNQSCTSLGTGAVALNGVTVGANPPGTFPPGCYSSGGAMNITASTTVTLKGAGTYIFRPDGAITTGATSTVALTNGASECDVFWTPTAATTLGANSTFVGTDIDAAGITIGNNVTWAGRALAFGGTVSTDADDITVPTCTPSGGILRVVKTVVNDDNRTAIASGFSLHVKLSGTDVTGSPAAGTGTPGTSYALDAGTYVVSEDVNPSYTQSFSDDCNSSGSVTLSAGEDKTCTITNNDTARVESSNDEEEDHAEIQVTKNANPSVLNDGEEDYVEVQVTKNANPLVLNSGPGSVTYTYKVTNEGNVSLDNVSVKDDKCSSVKFISGDSNNNSELDLDETWQYSCVKEVTQTETNVVTARGFSNGLEVRDTDQATVVVSAPAPTTPVPGFPNAGIGSDHSTSALWNIIISAGIFNALLSFYLARKKSTI